MTVRQKTQRRKDLDQLSKSDLIEKIIEFEEAAEIQPKIKKPKSKKKKKSKKRGAPEGHAGKTRPKPDHIDRVEIVSLDKCPDCGNKDIQEIPSQTTEHIQEDIIPAHVHVTKYVHHRYWCSCCKQRVSGYGEDEIPKAYLGPNVLIQTILMKYGQKQSYAEIVKFFDSFCGLKVTESALAQALQRIAKWLKVEEDVLLEAVRGSPYLHMDETGWKICGSNHWLWVFVNSKLALYRIRASRGQKVPEEVVGENYSGVVISDFWSAYNKTGRLRQRCLVHLKRDMKKILENDYCDESRKIYHSLNRILKDATRLDKQRKELPIHVVARRLRKLENRLYSFAIEPYKIKEWRTLGKRLERFYEEIFTFLKVPDIENHNNTAERAIRPSVIIRKISFQHVTQEAARGFEVLMSLIETLIRQGEHVGEFFKKAYLRHRRGDMTPLLNLSNSI